jgi:hypothetical protein
MMLVDELLEPSPALTRLEVSPSPAVVGPHDRPHRAEHGAGGSAARAHVHGRRRHAFDEAAAPLQGGARHRTTRGAVGCVHAPCQRRLVTCRLCISFQHEAHQVLGVSSMPGLLELKAPPLASDFLQPPVSSACLGCSCEGIKLRLLSPRCFLLGQLGQTPAPPLLCDVQHLADNRHPLEEGIGRAGVQSDLHLPHLLACLLSEHGRRQRLQQQHLSPSNRLEPAATVRRGVAPRVSRQGLLSSARLDALADLVPARVERIAHPEHHHPLATGKRRVTSSDRSQRAHGH